MSFFFAKKNSISLFASIRVDNRWCLTFIASIRIGCRDQRFKTNACLVIQLETSSIKRCTGCGEYKREKEREREKERKMKENPRKLQSRYIYVYYPKKNCQSGVHIQRVLFRSVNVVLNLVFIDYFKALSPKLRVTSSTNRYISMNIDRNLLILSVSHRINEFYLVSLPLFKSDNVYYKIDSFLLFKY